MERANALIPKTRRSRVITRVLTSFLDSIERRKVAEEYRAYYTQRSAREAREERALFGEWELSAIVSASGLRFRAPARRRPRNRRR